MNYLKLLLIFFVSVFSIQLLKAQSTHTDTDSLAWAKRTKYSLECVENLKKKDFVAASAMFDSEMKREINVATLENFWKQFLMKCGGELYELDNISRDEFNNFAWVFPSYKAKKDRWQFRIAFNEEDSIGAFFIDKYLPPPQKNKWKLPDYVSVDSVAERTLTLNKGKDYESEAFLTIPTRTRKPPCVIIVHDAGPWDKDGSRYSNKPFFDIAWGLASKGIACLRFDKRTFLHYKTIAEKTAVITPAFDTEEDVHEAIRLLKKRKDIDTNKILLIGHGLGATLTPRIAQKEKSVVGLIMLAPYGRPLEDALLEEFEYVMQLDTLKNAQAKRRAIDKLKLQTKNVKSPSLSLGTPTNDLPLETPASFWLNLRSFNSIKLLKEIKLPALILWGERDYRTTLTDFDNWKNGLLNGKVYDSSYNFIKYSDLNNIFMEGYEKSSPLEYHEPKNVSKKVVDDIAQWIHTVSH